MEVIYT